MLSIPSLWLPILLSAVAVFIAGALAWMVMPHHKKDFAQLPAEDSVLAAIRAVPPGQYMFPHCTPVEMKDPEVKRRLDALPHGVLNLWPGRPSMGPKMALNFLFNLTTGVFIAYLASSTVPPGAPFLDVFRVAATSGVMAYCFGGIPHSIWFGRSYRSMAMDFMDGALYGLITGAIFAALWPATV